MDKKLYSYVLPELFFVLSKKFGIEEEDIVFDCIHKKHGLHVSLRIQGYDIGIFWDEFPDFWREYRKDDEWNTKYEPDDGKLRQDVINNVCQMIKRSIPYLQEKRKENKKLIWKLFERVESLEQRLME
ncbi:hypothetical protein PMV_084 [Port-miou virus]|uniref:Uncharacterized protein n=1 Tax=Port-miou virus TaxID=1733873 RepID=A0A0N9PW28_9VIRU|nr:hypothetical protein PMV_084 [Port-miou virus]